MMTTVFHNLILFSWFTWNFLFSFWSGMHASRKGWGLIVTHNIGWVWHCVGISFQEVSPSQIFWKILLKDIPLHGHFKSDWIKHVLLWLISHNLSLVLSLFSLIQNLINISNRVTCIRVVANLIKMHYIVVWMTMRRSIRRSQRREIAIILIYFSIINIIRVEVISSILGILFPSQWEEGLMSIDGTVWINFDHLIE